MRPPLGNPPPAEWNLDLQGIASAIIANDSGPVPVILVLAFRMVPMQSFLSSGFSVCRTGETASVAAYYLIFPWEGGWLDVTYI
jgi:hypothetical protein